MVDQSLKANILKGAVTALPIVMGYIPVGFAYGVLAKKAGLSDVNILLMSLIVYGGASQFIAVGLLSSGAPPISIVVTTFIVNLRHFIMSSALAPYLRKWNPARLAAFTYELTDETFAVHSSSFASGVPHSSSVFATNITSHASWIAGSWLGIVAGNLIGDVKPFALDYALSALFIALITMQLKSRVQVAVVLLTGFLSIILIKAGMDQWNVIFATIIGASIGLVLEKWIKTSSS